MPFKRKNPTRRRRFRRRPNFKKAVKAIIASTHEKKYEDTFYSSVGISSSGQTDQLYTLASGSDEDERTGFKIRLQGIYGKLLLTNGDDTNVVRVVLYANKGDNSSTATMPYGIYNKIDTELYTVYMDKHIHLKAPFSGGTDQKQVIVRHNFKNKYNAYQGKYHAYDTIATTSGTNRIYMYIVSDSTAIAHPTVLGNIRCYYTDI